MAATSKVALVTGASSGIGLATASRLASLGYTVYGAARRIDRVTAPGVRPLAMDVTDDASMTSGIERVEADSGRIDVLVNNAGYGSYGAVEEVALDEARAQFEVNVFGAARLMQLVLPGMRTRRSGRIVNVTSMGGKIYTPMGGWYHATKFALEALSDCARLEVKPLGVDIIIVEPGAIKTEWGAIAAGNLRETSGSGPYAGQATAMARTLTAEGGLARPSSPEVVARTIGRAVTAARPKPRYVVGAGARPLIWTRRVLPDRAYDAVIRRGTGMPRSA